MSVAMYLTRPNHPDEVVSVVGNNELQQSWMPIVQANQLVYLEHAFGAGLSINDENHAEVIEETSRLLRLLGEAVQLEYDVTNPVYRCHRMLQVLMSNPPASGVSVYIG